MRQDGADQNGQRDQKRVRVAWWTEVMESAIEEITVDWRAEE